MDEAYRKKERVTVPKAELLTDRIEEIDRKLHLICVGDMVDVIYYDNGSYNKLRGEVHSLSPENKTITVGMPIHFDDIYDIKRPYFL